MLGIRRGEFVEIIRVSFPAESFIEVENRENISPLTSAYHPTRITLHSDRCMIDLKPVNEYR